MEVTIIGGGLAGSEAAYQLAIRGIHVTLCEMRPGRMTPAHKTGYLSELVCSNSLKSQELTNAHGLLKEEMRILGSLIVKTADMSALPGGKALVVERERFARNITEQLSSLEGITIKRQEVIEIPEGVVIVATGPLTSDGLSQKLLALTGENNLFFYDAISPIVDGTTIDMERAFFGSRYDPTGRDYLNCPMTEEEYNAFYGELIRAQRVVEKDFEKIPYFEGCLPIEIMAERGRQTPLYGPMKPVGVNDPRGAEKPHAVVQLRREDKEGHLYNIVGFQTKLTYSEQDRVFRLIPALMNADFFRYGSVHKNTYINSPALLTSTLQLRQEKRLFFAGQITGVEGYVESAAMGLIAGLSAFSLITDSLFIPPPMNTCIGELLRYITAEHDNFQPMNVNFGLFSNYNKKEKRHIVDTACTSIRTWYDNLPINTGGKR